jgi:hypothetical protein
MTHRWFTHSGRGWTTNGGFHYTHFGLPIEADGEVLLWDADLKRSTSKPPGGWIAPEVAVQRGYREVEDPRPPTTYLVWVTS